MAKLSDLKKVELLEEKVLSNDLDGVRIVLTEQKPIEFTAKALGLACRYCGAEMVEALIDGGATFSFTLTPVLKRKYDCKIALNNFDDLPINFAWYLFPKYEVKGYSNHIIDDAERVKVLHILHEKKMGDFSEILYYAILYNDDVIFKELKKLGVNELSEYRTDIVAGRISMNRLDAFGRNDRRRFQSTLQNYDDESLKVMLTNFLSCIKVETITLFPSDFYTTDWSDDSFVGKEKFISKFCSEKLFDLFVTKTNMVDKVKKWDLMFAIVEQNNPSAMQHALKEKWLNKPKDIDELLKHIQEQENRKPELIGYVLEQQHQKAGLDKKKKAPKETLSLDSKPLSAAELKKIWGTKKLDDGTLIIISYKGEDKDVVIPAKVGKAIVSAIHSDTFNPNAPRLNEMQQKIRNEISSVVFPGTIREIPKNMFQEAYVPKGRPSLKRVVLSEGIAKICDKAFYGCNGIEEIMIPDSVQEIGEYAFWGCRSLKSVKIPEHITILPKGIFCETGIETFEVEDRFTVIGESIFSGCKKLKSVKLPDSMTEIPEEMFKFCESLEMFTFPADATSIGEFAFFGCGLKECTIPEGVTVIEKGAFKNCKALKTVTVPKSVTIGESAFAGCNGLADDMGKIVVEGTLYGVLNPNGSWCLPAEVEIKPLILGQDIKEISVSIDCLPEIICREYLGESDVIDVESLSVGDEIAFGRFPMDDDYVLQPLKWRVLSKENEMALLITVNDIISLGDHVKQKGVWADSHVRKMLNDGFLNVAFTEVERAQISKITLHTPKNKEYGTDGGPDTEDQVFLLSVDEVEKYMPADESRKSEPTEYAHKQRPTKRDSGFWQLRTPGKDNWGSVAISDYFGTYAAMTGNHVGFTYVRPAIWVKNI